MKTKDGDQVKPRDQPYIESSRRHLDHIARIKSWAIGVAEDREKPRFRNTYFRKITVDYLAFLVPSGSRLLALGSGNADSFDRLNPSYALGVDVDPISLKTATERHTDFEFILGDVEDSNLLDTLVEKGPFDVILLEDTLGYIEDIQKLLYGLRKLCTSETRVISIYYGYMWEPLFRLFESIGLKGKSFNTTWLKMSDIENFMTLSGFETVKKEWRILCPYRIFGIGAFINRYIATLPLVRKICLRHYLVARPIVGPVASPESVSVVIPCRNERGNIESAVKRLPSFGCPTEIIFVEGYSTDGTWEEVERVKEIYSSLDIKSLRQPGEGKGDAVRAGFSTATGSILIILDADLTVPPEDLGKFFEVIASGQGEYVNGSRLIYGMEDQAMRYLNVIANHLFAHIFSFLINQRLTDTLCGTKVLRRSDYERISRNRSYFGDFDPFGDFDLIFGSSKLNLKIVEVPVRYASRRYGQTQISRFKHGVLLLRMVLFAYKKLKAI